jgi:hypothetical protein
MGQVVLFFFVIPEISESSFTISHRLIESANNQTHSYSGINTNGPAIKGGCVTRREHRAESWYFSREAVTVQGGYGALFAVQVQVL